jgi:hypothetical protein
LKAGELDDLVKQGCLWFRSCQEFSLVATICSELTQDRFVGVKPEETDAIDSFNKSALLGVSMDRMAVDTSFPLFNRELKSAQSVLEDVFEKSTG